LQDIGLVSCADVYVGNPVTGQGISGGQRRRLMIAVELVACPAVLILDEPTSGLDFASAFGVMKELADLANMGHTVISVVHQPSSQIWSLFDRVAFLSQGSFAYFGTPDDLLFHLNSIGHECPEFYNPSEFMLELIAPGQETSIAESVTQAFEKSDIYKEMLATIQDQMSTRTETVGTDNGLVLADAQDEQRRKTWFLEATFVLLQRNLLDLFRNPQVVLVRLLLLSFIAVLVGLTFLHTGERDTDEAIRSVAGALFFLTAFTGLISVSVVPAFMHNKAVVKKEIGNGRYSRWAYAAALILPLLLTAAMLAIVTSLISFYMIGLHNYGEYFFATFTFYLLVETIAYFSGSIVSHYLVGMLLVLLVFASGVAVQGYFIYFQVIGWSVRWLGYITPNRYLFRGLMRNEFENRGNLSSMYYPTGREYLNAYGFYDEAVQNYWIEMAIVYAFTIAFFCAMLLGLLFWQ
jgi:energy-coupling factor transporter ATP-binding protein EcfA2/ABC-type multidrug transport system permease subunit